MGTLAREILTPCAMCNDFSLAMPLATPAIMYGLSRTSANCNPNNSATYGHLRTPTNWRRAHGMQRVGSAPSQREQCPINQVEPPVNNLQSATRSKRDFQFFNCSYRSHIREDHFCTWSYVHIWNVRTDNDSENHNIIRNARTK